MSQKQIALRFVLSAILSVGVLLSEDNYSHAEPDYIPRRQSQVPGPPLSPEMALKKMTVPEGFKVELVAAEPDIINPVAMCFDEQGRIWVTESFEYPRTSAGPGRDRIKVLEDTDHNGTVDKVTIFAEGLNIPSGIAVGHGGVWVANAPDILFFEDLDGDLKADKKTVVVTGFGRTDTHELPNSLTWGPDGYLYGLNGVFNHSHVKHQGQEHKFTCAMFRINPRTHSFEIFCEGTSNPWGIAFDNLGSAFISACVIDHLWHLTETGYYHRQGGPYPPHTWKIESIVNHKHQMAAYCGIQYFDTDAYPEKYRNLLYMGNIHGNCINVDEVTRKGSTYFGKPHPDFLTANDVWFMPVAQKVGPDGCLYVLDWYDRFHCYQDARRLPDEIDRGHGRLYRVRYQNSPLAEPFNLSQESSSELIERLKSKNSFYRNLAQQQLSYRADPESIQPLSELVLNQKTELKFRLHALWSLIGMGSLDIKFHQRLLSDQNPIIRAWAVRAAGNFQVKDSTLVNKIRLLCHDSSPDVLLQVAIAANKIDSIPIVECLMEVLAKVENDPLIPQIVWQNLHPHLTKHSREFASLLDEKTLLKKKAITQLLPRAVNRILAEPKIDSVTIVKLINSIANQPGQSDTLTKCLQALAKQVQTGELAGQNLFDLKGNLNHSLHLIMDKGPESPGFIDAAMLSVSWKDPRGLSAVRSIFGNKRLSIDQRIAALSALISSQDESVLSSIQEVLKSSNEHSPEFINQILNELGPLHQDAVAETIISVFQSLPEASRPKAIELLTQRIQWSIHLLSAMERKQIDQRYLSVNQILKLSEFNDKRINQLIEKTWGQVRKTRDTDREVLISKMRRMIQKTPGNPNKGEQVFGKLCGQCHKIYGKGQTVGPDITVNGRGNFEQLLSNVFDPSLVIGKDYQAQTIQTTEGRILSGLLAEDNQQRVVLKIQGGKLEIIPRDKIESRKTSELSLMPEGIEKQLNKQEIADLFAFLSLSHHPNDPQAKPITGSIPLDPSKISLPKQLENQLLHAQLSTNLLNLGQGSRGNHKAVVFNPQTNEFLYKEKWHEVGIGFGANLGVITEEKPVYWMATWRQPIKVNLITLTGAYPNQPQANTAWKVEVKSNEKWRLLDQGVGDWYDAGRYIWGSPGSSEIDITAFRVSLFSSDQKTPLKSIHFRAEPNFSWFVGSADSQVNIIAK